VPSDEIRLYANDMQRSYTEYVTKLEMNLPKQLIFILLCLNLKCAEYEFETFGSTSDLIRLMAFYLHKVSKHDVRCDEFGIITNDL